MIIIQIACAENVIPVTTSFITIDPIGNHTIGDVFFINGTTNLPISENLTIWFGNYEWEEQSFTYDCKECQRIPPTDKVGKVENIPISPTVNDTNRWSANVTNIVKGLVSGEYAVDVRSYVNFSCNTNGCSVPKADVGSIFYLLPTTNAPSTTVLKTTIQSPLPIQPTTNKATIPTTTPSSSQSLVLLIALFAAIATLRHL
jgi:hypothetical protein